MRAPRRKPPSPPEGVIVDRKVALSLMSGFGRLPGPGERRGELHWVDAWWLERASELARKYAWPPNGEDFDWMIDAVKSRRAMELRRGEYLLAHDLVADEARTEIERQVRGLRERSATTQEEPQ